MLLHRRVPPNGGGISLGQAAVVGAGDPPLALQLRAAAAATCAASTRCSGRRRSPEGAEGAERSVGKMGPTGGPSDPEG